MLNKPLVIVPKVVFAFHNRSRRRPAAEPTGDPEGGDPPGKSGAPTSLPGGHLEPFWLLKFHSITDALHKHSDTKKGNIKVHLFTSMPSTSTDYSNQDQPEPKQQPKHGGIHPADRELQFRRLHAGKPVSSLRSSFTLRSLPPSGIFCLSIKAWTVSGRSRALRGAVSRLRARAV